MRNCPDNATLQCRRRQRILDKRSDVNESQQAIRRVHFLDEQARNRRISRLVAGLVVAALFVSGLPLSVFISPALVLIAVGAAYVADIFTTVPASVWDSLHKIVFLLPETWNAVRSDAVSVPWRTIFWLLVAPGTIAICIIWIFVRITFRRAGVGGVLRRIGAREPSTSGAERRLVNLVEEIAVSAGVNPPRVMVVDADEPNAVAIGLHIDDATIIVSTGLLSQLSRDEAQAIIAHVVSSVGNGDLRIAAAILSAIHAWGFVSLLIDTPLGATSRTTLSRVVKTSIDAARGDFNRLEAEETLESLQQGSTAMTDLMTATDIDTIASSTRHPLVDLFVTVPLLLTMGVASIAARTVVLLFTLLVSGPWIAVLWRSRRRLADASAVQLTRNPDALGGALQKLFAADVRIPGATSVNFLFPVWDRNVDKDQTRTDISAVMLRMHLDQEKRLTQIRKLGARTLRPDDQPSEGKPASRRAKALEYLRDIAQLLKGLAIVLVLLAGMMGVNLIAVSCAMMAAWWILKIALVTVPGWIRRAF